MAASIDVDVQGALVGDQETLNRGVAYPGVGIARDHDAGIEIGTAVEHRVHRDGYATEIDLHRVAVVDGTGFDNDRIHGIALPGCDALRDVLRQPTFLAAHEIGEQLARPVQAGEHRGFVSLDVFEQDRARPRLESGRDAGEIVLEIDL